MNKSEIDKLLYCIIYRNYSEILKMVNINPGKEDIEEYFNENSDTIIRKIMHLIEKGDLDYFLSKKDDDLYKSAILSTLLYSSRKDLIQLVLNDDNNFKYMNKNDIINILTISKDVDTIKSLIYGTRKIGCIDFNKFEICDLVLATDDSEFVKSVLKDIADKKLNIKVYSLEYIRLFEKTDKDFIVSIIKDEKYREVFDISNSDIDRYIIATKDREYIKSMIENPEAQKEVDFEPFPGSLANLVMETKDKEYIKSIIENVELRKKIGLKFTNNLFIKLMKSLDDPEYIKSFINGKLDVIDPEFDYIKTLDVLKEESKIKKEAKSADQNDYSGIGTIDEALANNLVYYKQRAAELYSELIKATNDKEYIKSFIDDHKKREELGITNNLCVSLIDAVDEPEFYKQIVTDDKKINELQLIHYVLLRFIEATKDPEFFKKIIEDKNLQDKYELSSEDMPILVKGTNDPEFINSYLKSIETEKEFEDKGGKIDLPTNMTIGMEIESEGENSQFIMDCKDKFAPGWKCKKDGSLFRGVEVVSPILTGDTNETTESIKYVCRRLERLRTGCF